jgi:hypothetical protein
VVTSSSCGFPLRITWQSECTLHHFKHFSVLPISLVLQEHSRLSFWWYLASIMTRFPGILTEFFCDFPQYPKVIAKMYLQMGYDSLLPHPFLLTIHDHSHVLFNFHTWRIVKEAKNQSFNLCVLNTELFHASLFCSLICDGCIEEYLTLSHERWIVKNHYHRWLEVLETHNSRL